MGRKLIYLLLLIACLSVSAQKGQVHRKSAVIQKSSQQKTKAGQKKTSTVKPSSKSGQKGKKNAGSKKPAVTVKGLVNERNALKKQKAANLKKQEELKNGVKRGMENLMILDHEIAQKQKVVDTIRNDVTQLDINIRLLDQQYQVLSEELEAHRSRYMKSVRYLHRNRTVQDQLMFIFSADNFNQMYRRLRFTREYAAYQRAQGEAVKSKQQQVEQKKVELDDSRHKKNVLLQRGQNEQKALEGKQTEQKKQVDKLKKQQQVVAALIEEQQRKEAELNQRIDKLIAEEVAREKARQEAEAKRKAAAAEAAKKRQEELERKKAAAEAARKENERRIAEARRKEEEARLEAERASQEQRAEAERKARAAEAERKQAERKASEENQKRQREIAVAQKSEADFKMPAEDRMMSGGFESNKGRLPLPITGPYHLIRGYGTYSPDGLSHVRLQSNGWHLKGQSGAKAQCIFDGIVSGVYYQGGSYIVTVRHGKYISAYINLSNVNVQKGQHVRARTVLGSLGNDHTMQFQLRHWSSLLNPSHWLRR